MLRPFITVLEWAAVLVIVFYPVHKRLAQKIKRRGLSALLSSVLVIIILVLPVTFLTIALANELAGSSRLHELFVFFSVLGGMSVFGLLGIVLGPVVLAITLGLLDTFKQEKDEGNIRKKARFPVPNLSRTLSLPQAELRTK